jgi:hypothetical protein
VNRTPHRNLLLLASHAGRSARTVDVCLDALITAKVLPEGVVLRLLLRLTAPGSNRGCPYFLAPFTPRKYQPTIESSYGFLPRPPQAPAARFKRLYRK